MKSNVETENDKMNGETANQEGTSSKKKLFIIGGIAIGIIVIVAIIVIVVLVTKDDDDSSSSSSLGFEIISWEEAYSKAEEDLAKLNLTDKVNLLYGIGDMSDLSGIIGGNSKINLNQINLQDGPSGVRTPNKTTSWPAGINLASTFNRTLMYNVGKEQGNEFRVRGIHIMLGPCMNMMRTPLGGRMWEAYGEDPFLSGATATEVIKGIQENGVIAVAKHYVGNEVEKNRRNSTSNIPEQALWEIYIEPFYRSVKDADVCSIMSSYNDVNGTLLAKNYRLLQTILKDTIGFKGFVMSDWFAIKDNDVANFNSGEDMNMPGKYSSVDWTKLEQAVNDGTVKEERVNDAAKRILAAQYKLGQRKNFPSFDFSVNTITEATKQLNREAAGQSNVLLKNEGNVLPITKDKYPKIAVLGNNAFPNYCINSPDNLCSCRNDTSDANANKWIWDGHLSMGYGSGATVFNYLIDPLSAITEKANKLGISIVSYGKLTNTSEDNYGVTTTIGHEDITGVQDLLTRNTDIDLCLIFIMANSGEELLYLERSHGDRYNMDAWHDGNNLVTTVAGSSSCGKKVVVINAPGPINVPWLSSVDGVVFSGMGAAESGNGIADVLFGDLNPSGHLPYAWGELNQYPGTINFDDTTYSTYNYNEGVFVGQRYFDKNNVNPIFPFGFGLSYTTFTFSGLTTTYDSSNKKLTATFNVKNDGSKDGDVVPMLFLKFPTIDEYGTDGYPSKLFKGFDKVFIKSGETKSVSITVDEHALSYYSESEKKFKMVSGTYDVYIGLNAGSDYNKLTKTVNIS